MIEAIVIIGSGAHARKLFLYSKLLNLNIRLFIDENPAAVSPSQCIPCIHTYKITDFSTRQPFIVAIGNPIVRKKYQEKFQSLGWKPITLIHPTAYVAEDARIGLGSVICAQAVVETGSVVGDGCIIDIGASVDHDCEVANYCHLKAGSALQPYTRMFY